MAFNKITSLFSKNKKKSNPVEEPEEEPKILSRRYSYSKSGRMKAKEYTRKTVSGISLEKSAKESGESVEFKKSEEVDGNKRKDSIDEKIDDVVKELQDIC